MSTQSIEKHVLAVKLKFRSGLGRFTLHDKWLNIKRNKEWEGVTFPTVPFLKPELSANFDSTKDAFIKNIEDVGAKSMGEGVYFLEHL